MYEIPVRKISSSHISKPVTVEGKVRKILPVKVRLTEGAFQCQRCDHTTHFKQPLTDKLIEPFECENETCGRKGSFKLIHEESTWIDEQRLELQDLDEQTKTITVLVRGQELIDTIPIEGSDVVITGIVRVLEKSGSSLYDKVLEAEHISLGMKSPRDKITVLLGIIKDLQDEGKEAIPIKDIVIKAGESGIKKEKVEDLIHSLLLEGTIIEVARERFKVVELK